MAARVDVVQVWRQDLHKTDTVIGTAFGRHLENSRALGNRLTKHMAPFRPQNCYVSALYHVGGGSKSSVVDVVTREESALLFGSIILETRP